MCGYQLPTNVQNFTQKDFYQSKNIVKSLRGLLNFELPGM